MHICARCAERRGARGIPGVQRKECGEVEGYEGECSVAGRANDRLAGIVLACPEIQKTRATTHFGASILQRYLKGIADTKIVVVPEECCLKDDTYL